MFLQTCNRVELYYGDGDVSDEVAGLPDSPQAAEVACRTATVYNMMKRVSSRI